VINADSLDYRTVTKALEDGRFYASEGPEIYELWYEDGMVHIRCSDADHITCNYFNRSAEVAYSEFGEPLDEATVEGAVREIYEADLLIIGGTSLTVYPAAALIEYFNNGKIVLINRDPTPRDNIADLVINASLGQVFDQIKKLSQ
jgi:NAD-dependent SIR2 family protein deacetylase